uniref:Uncharacterized protein n=1 Tax=Oryza glumipatula TaxID=40148 RepID=A0A0D9ZJI3_9ORYZ
MTGADNTKPREGGSGHPSFRSGGSAYASLGSSGASAMTTTPARVKETTVATRATAETLPQAKERWIYHPRPQ